MAYDDYDFDPDDFDDDSYTDEFDSAPDEDGLYDEDGDPIDLDEAWLPDEVYDAWGDPVERDLRSSIDPDDEVLPSGYTRRQYKEYGATDGDIEYWGLDEPDAPPPETAGWVVWEMADEMEKGDGCGLALAAAFFSLLAGGIALLIRIGRPG